jgi:hypothetical protein
MKSLLVGEAATRRHQEAIAVAFETPETIDRVIHMRTMHLGPEELLVAAKLAVGSTDRADVVARAIDDAEREARAAVPDLDLVIYIEPDIDRDAGPVAAERGEALAATGEDVPAGEHADGGADPVAPGMRERPGHRHGATRRRCVTLRFCRRG